MELYTKWVNERGVTNYSETPPDAKGANAKAQSININRYVPRGSENAVKQLEQQRTEKAKTEKSAKENKEGVKKQVKVQMSVKHLLIIKRNVLA